MQKINLLSIDIEGFRSIVEPFSFSLTRPGLNIIRGTNGVGKTTVFEALVWAIYGVNLKDTNQDKIPSWPETRKSQWRGTRVVLQLTIGGEVYAIARHIGFAGLTEGLKGEDRLMVFDSNGLKGGLLNKDETQAFINSLLGLNSRTFLNSVLFGQRMTRLITQDNKDKRELFEQMFEGMDWVREAKEKSDKKYKEMEIELNGHVATEAGLLAKQTSLAERIDVNKGLLETFFTSKAKRIEDEVNRGTAIWNEIKAIESSIEEIKKGTLSDKQLKSKQDRLKEVNTELDKLDKIATQLEEQIKSMDASLTEKNTQLNDTEEDINNRKEELANFDANQAKQTDDIIEQQKSIKEDIERLGNSTAILKVELKQYADQDASVIIEKIDALKKSKESLQAIHNEAVLAVEAAKTKIAEAEQIKTGEGERCYACGQELLQGNVLTTHKDTEISEQGAILRDNAIIISDTNDKLAVINRDLSLYEDISKKLVSYNEGIRSREEKKLLLKTLVVEDNSKVKDLMQKTLDTIIAKYNTDVELYNKLSDDKAQKQTELSDLEKKYDPLTAELSSITDAIDAHNSVQTTISEKESDKASKMAVAQEIAAGLDKLRNQEPPEFGIEKLELELDDLAVELDDIQEVIQRVKDRMAIATWWSSKAFGASGIKAFIFKAMLSKLNQNFVKYGQRLGVSMEFSIDMSKASKPFTTTCSIGSRLNKDYAEFSGGQKQRLDIVLIFAMYDLISVHSDINILVMDEVFEGLDEEGEAAVFDLIRMKADEGKSVYVISHSQVLDSLYSQSINFEFTNGTTKLKS